jgi:hypothetical protein
LQAAAGQLLKAGLTHPMEGCGGHPNKHHHEDTPMRPRTPVLFFALALTVGACSPLSAADAAGPVGSTGPVGSAAPAAGCWSVTGGAASLSAIASAHPGAWAGQATGHSGGSATRELGTTRSTTCGLPVTAGNRYLLGAWYTANSMISPMVYAYAKARGWWLWYAGAPLSSSSTWARTDVTTPAVPAGVTHLGYALAFPATGRVRLDALAVREADAGRTASAATGAVLFAPTFPAASGLVTNEYAYWNPSHSDAAKSSAWEMTSGSLFSSGGYGYTGRIDGGRPDPQSKAYTDSAVFRLNTRNYSYSDVRVAASVRLAELGSTSRTPEVDWDGVHIWLRYQSQYQLYYASVARRDGRVVIKKKCPGGPSNDGTYYELTKEITGYPIVLNAWRDVAASVRTNADGTVTIVLYLGGKAVVSGTDTGVGCPAITRPGSVGIRGDNARFYINGFTVTSQ